MTFCRERLMVATFSSGSVCEAWIWITPSTSLFSRQYCASAEITPPDEPA